MTTTLDSISLSDDLEWADEFSWSAVEQAVGYGASGALFVQEGLKLSGRPITLLGKEDMAWITRETAVALLAKINVAGLHMTLTLSDTRVFNVMFRQSETALDVVSVLGYNALNSGEWFKLNSLKLMEVPVV